MERQVRDRPAVPEVFEARAGPDPAVSPAQVLLSEPEEAAALYRGLSRQPALSAACLGPEVTTQYGGRYRTVHTGVCMKGNRGEEGDVEGSLPDGAHECVEEGRSWKVGVEGCLPKRPCAHRCMGWGWGYLEYYELVPMSAERGPCKGYPHCLIPHPPSRFQGGC